MNIACATFLPVGKADTEMVLGDIKANDTFVFLADTVQTLTGTGGTLAMYTYCSAATITELGDDYGLQEGWYDYKELENWDWESPLTYTQKNDVDIPAGYGFIVQSGYEGSSITIPAAL